MHRLALCSKLTDVAAVAAAAAEGESARLLTFSNDAEMECLQSDQLATEPDRWLSGCSSLTSLDFTGLTSLATVGDDWLSGCTSLTSLDCAGLVG